MEAAEVGRVSQIKLLRELHEETNAVRRSQNWNKILGLEKWEDEAEVIHVAADSGCYEICRVLLDEIEVEVDVVGGHWGTALQAAAAFGHEKIVWLRLSSGADVEAKADYFPTALHAGSYNSHNGVTRILLEVEADINAQSDSVGTVLYEAERWEQCSSMLNPLRQRGAEDLPPIELCVEGETDFDEWNWEEDRPPGGTYIEDNSEISDRDESIQILAGIWK